MSAAPEAIVAAAARVPLDRPPGRRTVYSDLGMILLGAVAERAGGADLETLVRREVLEPLQMSGAGFGVAGTPVDAVPTEACAWRGRTLRGEVHDENAFAMGGVSGHAGLFGTADDVARVGVAFLGAGRGWLSPEMARGAVQRSRGGRAIGWDTHLSGDSGGTLLSPGSFGHTGFTVARSGVTRVATSASCC